MGRGQQWAVRSKFSVRPNKQSLVGRAPWDCRHVSANTQVSPVQVGEETGPGRSWIKLGEMQRSPEKRTSGNGFV